MTKEARNGENRTGGRAIETSNFGILSALVHAPQCRRSDRVQFPQCCSRKPLHLRQYCYGGRVIRISSLSSAISLRRLRSLSARIDRCWRRGQSKPIFVLELSNSFYRMKTDCVGEIDYPCFPAVCNRRGPVSLRIV